MSLPRRFLVLVAVLVTALVGIGAWYFYAGHWRMERVRDRWIAADIDSYTMEVDVRCRCVISGAWEVVVERGEVSSLARDGEAKDQAELMVVPTLDNLLEAAVHAAASEGFPFGAQLVRIDTDGPVPMQVDIHDELGVDDAFLHWTITTFERG